MATNTSHYNLVKPLASENYDINVQNGNMDTIDAQLFNVNTLLTNFKRTDIANGTDLNSLTAEGFYGCSSASVAASLTNTPTTTVNFVMIVMGKSSTLKTQFIVAGANLYFRTQTSGGWGSWYQLTGTVVA